MIGLRPMLAAADLPLPQPTRVPRLLASDMVLILGLAAVIFVVIIAYIVFVRGSKSNIQRPSRHHHEESSDSTNDDSGSGRHRKRKRVRRREHRQRNPSLSQAGGLPPPRDPQQSSSPLG